jgi:hypothetical protein
MSKKTADRQAKIYYRVGELLEEHADLLPDAVHADYEDYRSDFHSYDVWSEDPANWEAENGRRPAVPLNSDRRAFYKKYGFIFKQDATVQFDPSKLL